MQRERTSGADRDGASLHRDGRWTPYAAARETHSAAVFFFGDRAYKVKKPVDLGFLDFTSVDARRLACRQELELNARLAADVYLGVTELPDPVTGTLEPVLVMRRMAEGSRLATLASSGADLGDALRSLAHLMASFHSHHRATNEMAAVASRDALAARWTASFAQVRQRGGAIIDADQLGETEELVLAYLAGRARLFEARIHRGNIVDGHGDLTAEDIFVLDDGPRVLDCLDFDPALRHVDQIDDVAFLAMDLERLGRATDARRFLDLYRELTADRAPSSLVHHYVAYRAFVRAKVSCLQHEQGASGAADTARTLAALTHRELVAGRVRLVLVGGGPGSGKTTLARGLAERLDLMCLSSDHVRKEMLGLASHESAAAPFASAGYSPEWNRRTYDEMLRRATRLLELGHSVVLDATWADPAERQRADDVAARTHSVLTELVCEVPPQIADERIRRRVSESDATPGVARQIRSRFAPWPGAVVIPTVGTPAAVTEAAVRRLTGHRPSG